MIVGVDFNISVKVDYGFHLLFSLSIHDGLCTPVCTQFRQSIVRTFEDSFI